MLDEHGSAILADFGVVKALERSTISMSGGILGTPACVAPEVWNDHGVTPATDVYALAYVLYEMVAGQQLFAASTPPATMALHFRELQLPQNWPDGVPPGLGDLLRRALAQNPAQRLQTAGALTDALTILTLDPLAECYAALQTALVAEMWPDAIALAESILALNATYKDTAALLRQASAGQMAAQQAIQAAQWREQAEESVAARNWQMASTVIQYWRQMTPEDPAAKQLWEEVQRQQGQTVGQLYTNESQTKMNKLPERKSSIRPVWVWVLGGTFI